jgi:CDGSH-type Zn-finger protein
MANVPFAFDLEKDKKYYWCSCGLSQNQPFCDGAHKAVPDGKKSFQFQSVKNERRFLCNCKQTKNPPFCDGTHSAI